MAARKTGLRATSGKRTLAFGLVRVSVGMAPLMESEARIKASLTDPDTGAKVKRQWISADDGSVVDEPVKAYPVGDGTVVTLDDGEVPKEQGTDLLELIANVSARDIPAEYVEKSYLLFPEDGTQDDGYALVLGYLRDNDRAMVGTTTASGTTKAFAVRYSDVTRTLVAQVLNYEANVRWGQVETVQTYLAEVPEAPKAMADMAVTVFDTLPDKFDWAAVEDDYGIALAEAVKQKAETGAVIVAPAAAPAAPAMDLMAALKASVESQEKVTA